MEKFITKSSRKKAAVIVMTILILWACLFTIDFLRAVTMTKPIFVLPVITADDGGSGIYAGLGYWYDIRGNFMPEEDNKGVTDIRGYLFGIPVVDKEW